MPTRTRQGPTAEQRDSGRQKVLDTIRAHGQIARIDIAQDTGFSPATVTAITSELIGAQLIEETQADDSVSTNKRGRPRVTLKISGAALLVAGVKVALNSITVLIADFEGNHVVTHQVPLTTPRASPESLVDVVTGAVQESCDLAGKTLDSISAMCVGLAGLVDANAKFVHWSSALDRRNVDLGKLFAERVPFPVFIDNDANLVAKAEQLFGIGQGAQNFLVVSIEHGVGLGIIINGEVYRGVRGCGAEFGHTKIQFEGALCQCGQRGCLEAYVGTYALLREYHSVVGRPVFDDVTELFAAAAGDDAMARSVLDRAGKMLALGLANLVNVFDPELIILAGAQNRIGLPYIEAAIKDTARLVVKVDAPLPPIQAHDSFGDLMWAKGAAALAIEKVSAMTVKELPRNAS